MRQQETECLLQVICTEDSPLLYGQLLKVVDAQGQLTSHLWDIQIYNNHRVKWFFMGRRTTNEK